VEEIIAYCGITCTECPAHIATQNGDADELKRVAERWSKQFQTEMKPDDVICDDCLIGHTRCCSYCAECEIRACAISEELVSCAHCDDYGCAKLMGFLKHVPQAKAKLEEIRASL